MLIKKKIVKKDLQISILNIIMPTIRYSHNIETGYRVVSTEIYMEYYFGVYPRGLIRADLRLDMLLKKHKLHIFQGRHLLGGGEIDIENPNNQHTVYKANQIPYKWRLVEPHLKRLMDKHSWDAPPMTELIRR